MPNNIAAIKNYTTILDRVYQREATSSCLNSPARMARAGRNAKEIMIPTISVTGLGDYTRNVGYKTGSRYLFITPTLKGVLDDYSLANPNMSNRVLTRFCRVVEVPQARFYTKIALNSGDSEKFGYAKATDGRAINFMVVENSAVIKFDKHVASRVFSPDELENLDSYMMKFRKYGIVELMDNKLAGVAVSAAPAA